MYVTFLNNSLIISNGQLTCSKENSQEPMVDKHVISNVCHGHIRAIGYPGVWKIFIKKVTSTNIFWALLLKVHQLEHTSFNPHNSENDVIIRIFIDEKTEILGENPKSQSYNSEGWIWASLYLKLKYIKHGSKLKTRTWRVKEGWVLSQAKENLTQDSCLVQATVHSLVTWGWTHTLAVADSVLAWDPQTIHSSGEKNQKLPALCSSVLSIGTMQKSVWEREVM